MDYGIKTILFERGGEGSISSPVLETVVFKKLFFFAMCNITEQEFKDLKRSVEELKRCPETRKNNI